MEKRAILNRVCLPVEDANGLPNEHYTCPSVFKEEKEGPDIVKDCTVKVDPKGLEIIQRVMNQKNDEPKP